ncbi:unnamed protein product, partial [Mesorhabditis spiculigera]
MGLLPLPAASPAAYVRLLFWFLLLGALPIAMSQADNQTSNVSDVPVQDPPSSTAGLPICENPRAFLCYVYEALDQPFPDWLQQTEQKCERCESPEVCKIGAVIAGHLDDDHDHNRLSVYDECHPPFCKDEQDMSEDTKCIKAVNFDGDKRGILENIRNLIWVLTKTLKPSK